MPVACVPNLGRFTREVPSSGGYMSTAQTTPSEKSVQGLAVPHMGDVVTIRF